MGDHLLRTRHVAVALGVLAVSVGLLACSSTDDKNAYVDELNAIQERTLAEVESLTSVTPDNKQQFIDQLNSTVDAVEGAVDEIQALDVPEEAQAGHDKFVEGVQNLADLFSEVASDAQNAAGLELIEVATKLQTESVNVGQQIDEAVNQINNDLR